MLLANFGLLLLVVMELAIWDNVTHGWDWSYISELEYVDIITNGMMLKILRNIPDSKVRVKCKA